MHQIIPMDSKENLSIILEKYRKYAPLAEIATVVDAQKEIFLHGLIDSSFSYALFSIFEQVNRDMFVIMNDREEAAYLYNEAQTALGDNRCDLLVSGFKRAIVYGQPEAESALLRSESLRIIADKNRQPKLIVTYPESLLETTLLFDQMEANTFTLNKNEELSIDFLTELLATYKFELVDFVYEPGQYAVRGSIVDIFSFSNTKPYRVDFCGDIVDSIRTFDLETQISDSHIDRIKIIPDLSVKVESENRYPITQILSKNVIVVYDDDRFTIDRLHHLREIADNRMAEIDEKIRNIIVNTVDLETELKSFNTIYRSRTDVKDKRFDFNTSSQPNFSKNFDLLQTTIDQYSNQEYSIIIVSEQQKQIERIQHIVEQINPKTKFSTALGTIHRGFIDHNLRLCVFTDHQIFDRYQKYRIKLGFTRKESLTIEDLTGLHPGDYVVHMDHGIGQFGGLEKIEVNGKRQEVVKLVYRDNDTLYVNIHALHKISKYKGKDATPPKIHKIGSGVWQNTKNNAKSKIKDIARELISLYAERIKQKGYAFSGDTYLNEQLEASFIYEDTPDQELATKAIKGDMENSAPMDRLICGDVGFGKTEIAIRGAFKAVCDNKQVAVLVPTTILAFQHFKTFSNRLKEFPVKIDYLSRMRSATDQKRILKELKEGTVDIIIGTHRISSNDIVFRDLGLLIIDEEQKFGVRTKEKLRAMKVNVDTLTMTATPIPRTLQFSLMGARDLSIIKTPPPNRLPITTEIHVFDTKLIADAVNFEVGRGGQLFFIHNRVQNIAEIETIIRQACPGVKTVHAHGQMEGKRLEKIMLDFIDEKYDVLVATTIIESGLDIPNANTIIINDAQNFGLSDLHQLRGRVGRSNKKAFCYLLTPPLNFLPSESRRRLQAIESFTELGSGFNIALQDLDIRGAGNLLGGEQSGFISELGYETYQRVLHEAMFELREQEFKNLIEGSAQQVQTLELLEFKDCTIETDLELMFPDSYIRNISERVRLYKQLDTMTSNRELEDFQSMLLDRFGKIPTETIELINVVRLRRKAVQLGLEKIILKQDKMLCYFISDKEAAFFDSDIFGKLILSIQNQPKLARMQEHGGKLRLIIEDVSTIKKAIAVLDKLYCFEE